MCFVDADWPLLGGAFRVSGVEVLGPNRLAQMVAAGSGPYDVEVLASIIRSRFPSA